MYLYNKYLLQSIANDEMFLEQHNSVPTSTTERVNPLTPPTGAPPLQTHGKLCWCVVSEASFSTILLVYSKVCVHVHVHVCATDMLTMLYNMSPEGCV